MSPTAEPTLPQPPMKPCGFGPFVAVSIITIRTGLGEARGAFLTVENWSFRPTGAPIRTRFCRADKQLQVISVRFRLRLVGQLNQPTPADRQRSGTPTSLPPSGVIRSPTRSRVGAVTNPPANRASPCRNPGERASSAGGAKPK